MTKFEDLGIKGDILKSIQEMGFETPTPIQEKVIPTLLEEDTDLVGLAQTGTGKTAAFGLPLLSRVDVDDNRVQGLILCPVRELALQITTDLKNFAKYKKGLKIVPVYGGTSIEKQIRELKRGAHVIVATPGRMVDLLRREVADISALDTVVFDEADEMLKMGFKDDMDFILDGTPIRKNVWLFSATMPPEVARISKNYMEDPLEVTVGTKNSGSDNVEHIYYMVQARDRYLALKRIVDFNPDIYSIVFCRTRQETKDVAERLLQEGYNADALHGDLSQEQRDFVMNKFRQKSLQVLVATDVAARGLDVDNLTHVIHYNLPDEAESYNHRSGRTGRAGNKGTSVSIVHMREKGRLRDIERTIKKKFTQMPVPSGHQVCERQLFHLVDRVHNVNVDHDMIDPYLPAVFDKLEDMSKEELIKGFVSLEFNRFLDYYKDSRDLNVPDRPNKREFDRERERRGPRGPEEGYTRFFVNIGKKDGINPRKLMDLINKSTKGHRVGIGRIDLMGGFSFFEVEREFENQILDGMNTGQRFGSRVVEVEIASNGGKSRGGGNRGGKRYGGNRGGYRGGRDGYRGGDRRNSGDRRDGGNRRRYDD